MATTTGLKLEGGTELIAALAELASLTTERTSRATVVKAMDKALEPVAEKARALAPRSGLTTRTIRLRNGEKKTIARKHIGDGINVGGKLKKSNLNIDEAKSFWQAMRMGGDKDLARVNLRAQRRADKLAGIARAAPPIERFVGASSSFATLVEFGTGPRRTKKGKNLGAMAPRPFLRPAWDAEGPAVMTRLTAGLKAALDKKIARAKKKKGLV